LLLLLLLPLRTLGALNPPDGGAPRVVEAGRPTRHADYTPATLFPTTGHVLFFVWK